MWTGQTAAQQCLILTVFHMPVRGHHSKRSTANLGPRNAVVCRYCGDIYAALCDFRAAPHSSLCSFPIYLLKLMCDEILFVMYRTVWVWVRGGLCWDGLRSQSFEKPVSSFLPGLKVFNSNIPARQDRNQEPSSAVPAPAPLRMANILVKIYVFSCARICLQPTSLTVHM